MSAYFAEFLGTMILIIFGNGVVSNVVLKNTKGNNSGWIVITFGWAMAVFIGVFITSKASGAHLNPAVTVALAVAGKFAWADVATYIVAQMLGAVAGGILVWAHYRDHFDITENPEDVRACFCNSPAIRRTTQNLFSEIFATFIFVLAVLFLSPSASTLGSLDALPVALIVFAIGLSLGGNTGYAINPARDFGPRISHALVPIKGKGGNDWGYSWIPVLGPILGGILAALVYTQLVV